MKISTAMIKNLFFSLFFFNSFMVNAQDISPYKNKNELKQILIESNTQRSDFENSIFYAEGDVKITNKDKDFFAKSRKAIFYKLDGIIKLIGDAEVISNDSSKINAGEIHYYLENNRFEAISIPNQRVNTKFTFGDDMKTKKL